MATLYVVVVSHLCRLALLTLDLMVTEDKRFNFSVSGRKGQVKNDAEEVI